MAGPRADRRFPDSEIAGGGLRLRALRGGDIDDVAAACVDPLTQRWLPLPRPYTRETALAFVSDFAVAQRDSGDGVVFAVEVDGRLHGCIDLKHTDWNAATTEVGYWVAPWGRGAGLAGRAAAVLARWALTEQGMERVEIRAAVDNVASQRAAEVAGFTREGLLRSAGYTHDGRVDLVVYGLLRADLT